jgi:hypothetical protein
MAGFLKTCLSDKGDGHSSRDHHSTIFLVRASLARPKSEGKRLGRPRIPAELEERIRKTLAAPGRPGVRKIAEQFGVDPGTVQRISRPFETSELVA